MISVDINCDVGEGMNNEELLMPYISSCSIACGGHAGNVETMDHVIRLAQAHGVKIGAHPSFPDKENFGRKTMDISMQALTDSLVDQITLLQKRLHLQGGSLHHVKAHGALYNLSIKNREIAEAVVCAVKQTDANAFLYLPFSSKIEEVALEQQLNIKYEVFADRNYNDDLSLVSRSQKNALITHKDAVLDHLLTMLLDHQVQTVSNRRMPIKAATFCVHGDNKAAIDIIRHIHQSLTQKGIAIA